MAKPKDLSKAGILAVLIVVCIAGGSRHIAGFLLHGGNYYPLSVTATDAMALEETFAYASRVNRVLRGDVFPADVATTYEHKSTTAPIPIVSSWMLALLALATGGVNGAYIAADFVFAPLIFALAIFLLERAKLPRSGAILVALTIVLGDRVLHWVWIFANEALGRAPSVLETELDLNRTMFILSRTDAPQVHFAMLLGYLAALTSILAVGSVRRRWLLATGLLGSAVLLTTHYFWAPALIATGAAYLGAPLMADRGKREQLRWVLLGHLPAALVFLVVGVTFAANDASHDILQRLGMVDTHGVFRWDHPRNTVAAAISTIAFLYALSPSRPMTSNVARRLVLFTVAGAWITFFSPIVIGKNLQNFHVIFYVGYPLAIALAAFMIGDVLKATSMLNQHSAARALKAGAAALAIATLSAVFALDLATTVSNAGPHWTIDHEVREVLSWLEANARKDQVVLTDDLELNLLLSTYTRVRSYVPNGAQSLNSHAEQADRAAVATALLRSPSRDRLIVGTEPPPTFGFPLPSPLYLFHPR